MPSDDVARARLDGLTARLEDFENEREAIAKLPSAVSGLASTVTGLAENQREMRKDVRDLRRVVDERFDKVDGDHATISRLNRQAIARPTFWEKLKDTLAVLVPIIIALIAAWATITAAGVHP